MKRLYRFTAGLTLTAVMGFVAFGPTWEGFSIYTCLAFTCGIIAGVGWGVITTVGIALEMLNE